MREFKFRCWDITQQMIYNIEAGKPWKCNEGKDKIITIMQWTGLQDKKGKDIYEGDIMDTRYGIATVKYSEGHGGFIPFAYPSNVPDSDTETEIIGNIFENPELLKEG